MSSAIEVLKRIIEESKQEFEKTTIAEVDIFEKDLPELEKALLALEKKEKLKKWLEKNVIELKQLEEKLKDVNENYYINSKLRRIVLEEVLELMK